MTDGSGSAPVPMRHTALAQVAVCSVVGLIGAVAAGVWGPIWLAPLVGWDAFAMTYLIWTWSMIGHLDADGTKGRATIQDPTQRQSDLLLLCASAASLVAVGIVIVHASRSSGVSKGVQLVLAVVSVVVAWVMVHTTYTLRYAKLYHDGDTGGVDFNQDALPRYGDFAYLAFTIGMTFQVSDTSFTSSVMRRHALRHALLSYLYGTVIIASAINLLAGLTK